jgi:hypothetical protein
MPFRPTSIAVRLTNQDRLDRIAPDAAERRQPGQAIWKGPRAAIARIKNDGQWDEVIPPDSIPSRLVREFGASMERLART